MVHRRAGGAPSFRFPSNNRLRRRNLYGSEDTWNCKEHEMLTRVEFMLFLVS